MNFWLREPQRGIVATHFSMGIDLLARLRAGMMPLFVLICLSLLSCGSGEEDSVVRKRTEVQDKLRLLEAQSSAADEEAQKLLKQSWDTLDRVHDLIIESKYTEADTILDGIVFKLDRYIESGVGLSSGEQGLEVHGQVEYRPVGGSEFQKLSGGEKLADIAALRTLIRSGIVLKLTNGAIFLNAQSEVTINRYYPSKSVVHLALEKGTINVVKDNVVGVFLLDLDGFQGSIDGEAELEMARHSLTGTCYIAVHRGGLSWQEGEEKGSLTKFGGFKWSEGVRLDTALPLAPNRDSPEPFETFYAGSGKKAEVTFRWYTQGFVPDFQIQISTHPLFVKRVYDRSDLAQGDVKASLAQGEYYWRVRGFSQEKVPGPFTKVMVLYVTDSAAQASGRKNTSSHVPKEKGPPIRNPKVEIHGPMVIVSGTTVVSARVRVNGESAVMLEEGRFRHVINFDKVGTHLVRITALDTNSGAQTVVEKTVEIVSQ